MFWISTYIWYGLAESYPRNMDRDNITSKEPLEKRQHPRSTTIASNFVSETPPAATMFCVCVGKIDTPELSHFVGVGRERENPEVVPEAPGTRVDSLPFSFLARSGSKISFWVSFKSNVK